MSKKRLIKHCANNCLMCAKEFKNWNDKHINKINRSKRHSKYNSVVLCLDCKNKLTHKNIEIFQEDIADKVYDLYFKSFDLKSKDIILSKLFYMKFKNTSYES